MIKLLQNPHLSVLTSVFHKDIFIRLFVLFKNHSKLSSHSKCEK